MTAAEDPYVGMSPEDAARARAHLENQAAIQRKREDAARALLAPPGPAEAVKAAWRPLGQALEARKDQAVTGGQENRDKAGGGRRGTHGR